MKRFCFSAEQLFAFIAQHYQGGYDSAHKQRLLSILEREAGLGGLVIHDDRRKDGGQRADVQKHGPHPRQGGA